MKTNLLFFICILTLGISINLNAQEETEHNEKSTEHSFKRHSIFLLWGDTFVPAAKTAEGENSVVLFPSWGVNYEYKIKHNYGVALMSEFEMQSYAIEHDEHAEIDREYPIIVSAVFVYEPVKHLALFAGPGIEFEKTQNFSIIKAGVAATFTLPKHYGIAFEFSYERKNKTYDAWTFGILVGKGFGKTIGH